MRIKQFTLANYSLLSSPLQHSEYMSKIE